MAYDPKDPEDKKIVQKLIDDALAAQAEEHEAEVTGLKAKRTELLQKVKDLRAEKGDTVDVTKLESDLEAARAELKKVNKDLTKATTDLQSVTTERDGLNTNIQSLLVDQGLTTALAEAKVPTQFLPAVKALLSPKVALKTEGDQRKAMVGDKPLGEFVKEWSQGDEGKAYIAAPVNGGGGAGGPQGGGGGNTGKSMMRDAFDALEPAARSAFMAEGGTLTDPA